MQINEQQAELILNAFSAYENESMLGDETLVLASEIMEAFPGLNHDMKSVCEEVPSYLFDRDGVTIHNIEGINRLQDAKREIALKEPNGPYLAGPNPCREIALSKQFVV